MSKDCGMQHLKWASIILGVTTIMVGGAVGFLKADSARCESAVAQNAEKIMINTVHSGMMQAMFEGFEKRLDNRLDRIDKRLERIEANTSN